MKQVTYFDENTIYKNISKSQKYSPIYLSHEYLYSKKNMFIYQYYETIFSIPQNIIYYQYTTTFLLIKHIIKYVDVYNNII